MKVLSARDAATWCQTHEIALWHDGMPDRSDADVKFEVPGDAQKRIYLVSQVMDAFRSEPLVLVWFNDWSVWPSGQRMHVFDRFRMSYGETRPLVDAPGHLFDQSEIEDATSFVTIAALFLWDCYVVTPSRTSLLYLSHDEYGATKGIDLLQRVAWLNCADAGVTKQG